MKKTLIISGIILFLGSIIASYFYGKSSAEQEVSIIQKDPQVITRYREASADTVVKWYEKPFKGVSEPEVIYVQQVDSVFIEKARRLDLIVDLKIDNRTAIVYVYNQDQQLLKEQKFENIPQNFHITSQEGRVKLTYQKWYWNNIGFKLRAEQEADKVVKGKFEDTNIELGLTTGLNYKQVFYLNSELLFKSDTKLQHKDFFIGLETEVYPFR